MISLKEFIEYIEFKKIKLQCPLCNNIKTTFSLGGNEYRAKIKVNEEIRNSEDINDNVGLGLVETTVNSEGKTIGIRDGGYPIYFLRCDNCGYLMLFDAQILNFEYEKIKSEVRNKNNKNSEEGVQ